MSPRTTALPVPRPVVLVHGMWLHASSWRNWIDLFAAEGFDAIAPAWPGERATAAETRAAAAELRGLSMARLVTHFAELLRGMPVQPILIGHSLGGTVVQALLSAGYGAGGVLLDSARFDGELPGALPALRLGLPDLAAPGAPDDTLTLTDYQFRFAFGRSLEARESDECHRKFAIPAPARILLQPETAGIDLPAGPRRKTAAAAPLLVVESAGSGAGMTPSTGSLVNRRRSIYDAADAEARVIRLPNHGASLAFDGTSRAVAARALEWVQDRFGTGSTTLRTRAALRGTAA